MSSPENPHRYAKSHPILGSQRTQTSRLDGERLGASLIVKAIFTHRVTQTHTNDAKPAECEIKLSLAQNISRESERERMRDQIAFTLVFYRPTVVARARAFVRFLTRARIQHSRVVSPSLGDARTNAQAHVSEKVNIVVIAKSAEEFVFPLMGERMLMQQSGCNYFLVS